MAAIMKNSVIQSLTNHEDSLDLLSENEIQFMKDRMDHESSNIQCHFKSKVEQILTTVDALLFSDKSNGGGEKRRRLNLPPLLPKLQDKYKIARFATIKI
ncbi:hypothetical protein HK096_001208 [Nowakowskiella sp. JEL0078]|nr:hypothetical protein HK096_001208 [Nowakowskiella sp. JEL0078]